MHKAYLKAVAKLSQSCPCPTCRRQLSDSNAVATTHPVRATAFDDGHPVPDPPRTKRSYEFTDFGEQAFGAAYAAQACEETAAAKRRVSLSSREDAAGRSVLLATRTSFTNAH